LKELDVSTVIYGDIQTKSLTKSKTATTGLNKATQGRGDLARVKTFLAYKAAEAGMSVVLQNEAYTSRTNCLTGELFASLSLADRELELLPDLVIDRDVNGAVNIAQKALRGKWSASEDFIRSLRKLDAVSVE
jgi:putative transposase